MAVGPGSGAAQDPRQATAAAWSDRSSGLVGGQWSARPAAMLVWDVATDPAAAQGPDISASASDAMAANRPRRVSAKLRRAVGISVNIQIPAQGGGPGRPLQ